MRSETESNNVQLLSNVSVVGSGPALYGRVLKIQELGQK